MAVSGTQQSAFCLFGASGAQYNLGVGALRAATLGTLLGQRPESTVTVFDDGWGVRPGETYVAGESRSITLCGARLSRRLYRPEAFLTMRVSGMLGGWRNAGLANIDAATAVLDVSGGDSFSDLYGERTFRMVAWPKRLALLRGRPLVFLPQTYGPFRSQRLRAHAASLVRRSALAWARDPYSYEALRDLLGEDFDPARHRLGVDVAFALEPRPPAVAARDRLTDWWQAQPGPVVGVNASGFLLDHRGRAQFDLRADGWRVMLRLCRALLEEAGARIVLIPHVYGAAGHPDDDLVPLARLRRALAPEFGNRIAVAPRELDAHQAKWIISRTSWFVGTRMHATIAALSAGVPAAIIAYSMKARGVFATVGLEHDVADARHLDDESLFEVLWRSWARRSAGAVTLSERLPAVRRRAAEQIAETVDVAQVSRAGQHR